LAAAVYPGVGEVFNLGGGTESSVLNAIHIVEKISGLKAKLKTFDRQKGDVRHTRARLDSATEKLRYCPKVSLEEGLAQEWHWIRTLDG
jgi:UDP-glucose 4-epimerase